MKPDDIDWGPGEVVHWSLEKFDADRSLQEQLDELREDLAQVRFDEHTLLDLGWYPECDADGAFVVTVVRNEDWDEPVFREAAKAVPSLHSALARAVSVATEQATVS
ncbi:MAG: hypothetical protein R3B48_17170 [Kofleriaceae bacterium]